MALQRTARSAALFVALFTIVVGVVGLVSPDSVTAVRRSYFATPVGLYAAAAVRVAMGLVVILSAPHSRAPKTLRALGAVMCMQGLAATLLGPDRARATLEWETMQGTALLRVGAAVALAAGSFLAFAVVTGHRSKILDGRRERLNSR
jgi:multisubunit Na+/H+ antiporter MnhB subunit